jgi:very-short-patch-repair endonuclease
MRRQRVHGLIEWRARSMRREPTPAEAQLWEYLRDRRLHGWKFRRQHSFQSFILDFYCAEASLVVELDGSSHNDKQKYDSDRTCWLEVCGMEVVRFENRLVFDDIEHVLTEIHQHCLRRCPNGATA